MLCELFDDITWTILQSKMKHGLYSCLLLQLVIYLTLLKQSKGIHLKGTFKTNEFFKFIGRFGFQKTDVHNEESTKGYIYGNISLVTNVANQSIPIDSLVTLAVLDYNYFIDYYKMRHISPKSSACALMFDKINTIAYFYECNEKGNQILQLFYEILDRFYKKIK